MTDLFPISDFQEPMLDANASQIARANITIIRQMIARIAAKPLMQRRSGIDWVFVPDEFRLRGTKKNLLTAWLQRGGVKIIIIGQLPKVDFDPQQMSHYEDQLRKCYVGLGGKPLSPQQIPAPKAVIPLPPPEPGPPPQDPLAPSTVDPPPSVQLRVTRKVRDSQVAADAKRRCAYRCQLCGDTIRIPGRDYAE